ncbi:MAG: insulinase family protein [Clostridia bacterium]|nr:insulinase family protein [Clostridia bacterium]
MKNNDTLYGFKVKEIRDVAEISAKLIEMRHEKSGATLFFLDREDENKTFAISFKTIPEDSTGVFHIIEHSVLCGSEKYTTKEPFVELLKGSLNTFLNAMTFPDKTVYPVASRNDKDFSNLVSVYMDAVLNPAILHNKNIFLQEGWHYELDSKDGEMTRSGVVLNEMRGSFSSADELSAYHLTDMLFPDSCYRFESGGKPEFITDLTYEHFIASHQKYYHPSNSQIFLDGSVDLDSILPMLDEYLSPYDAKEIDFDIEIQSPVSPEIRRVEYEIAPNESPENKMRLSVGYVNAAFDEQEKNVATTVLLDAVCSSNESPLKKAIIASGLCEDLILSPYDSMKQNSVVLDFRNVKDGECEKLYALFLSEVKALASAGIDRSLLEASLNSFEFKIREKDFGTLPRGIIYVLSMLESSLYGGDPVQNLCYSDTFEGLREKLSEGYFEELMLSIFVDNPHRAMVIMTPSATLGEERAKAEKETLARIKASLSDKQLDEIMTTVKELKAWQEAPDSPEALATTPELKLSDIPSAVEKLPQILKNTDGVTTLIHDVATNGILYTDMHFDVSDLTPEELFDLRILLALMQNVPTEAHTAIELQSLIKRELGDFGITMSPVTKHGGAKAYTTVSVSVLESKQKSVAPLLHEVLYTSIYTDRELARSIVKQMKIASDEAFVTSGHSIGITRAAAAFSTESAIQEYFLGYEAHKSLKELAKSFDECFDALAERLSALAKRIFTKNRLTLSLTGAADKSYISGIIDVLADGDACELISKIKPFGAHREGIVIPAEVSYAEMAASLSAIGERLTGSMSVARSLISLGYLWSAVRVQGGAYGVGLTARINGNVAFYSYRDPSPERTLGCYKESAAFLRSYAESGEDITKFIISALRDASPLLTPKLRGTVATSRYLRGVSYEDECRTRSELLATDKNELLRIADVIDRICEIGSVCVVAGKDKLDTCKDLDVILEI